MSDPAPSRAQLLRLLNEYAQQSNALAETFAVRAHLHPTDLHALVAVVAGEKAGVPVQPAELVGLLGRSSGSVSTALDRLERAGHIHRERSTSDRRRVYLRHDPRGTEVAERFFGELAARADTVLDEFRPAELAVLARFLERITTVVADYRAEQAAAD